MHTRWYRCLALAAVLAAGAYLRFHHIGDISLNGDEILSPAIAGDQVDVLMALPDGKVLIPPANIGTLKNAPSWPHILTGMGTITHPPLYWISLRWWMDVFGTNDTAIRSMSA